jgi:UDP-glucose 4-epimerase
VDSVLVTGGEGFIGRHVRASLAVNGANVICLDSKPHSGSGRYCYQGDITNPEQIARAFDAHSISAVVHLASSLRTASIENPQKATEVNVLGTLNILEGARKAGVRRRV